METVYLFERGILGWQSLVGDYGQWPNEATTWINRSTSAKAQTLTYFTGPILAAVTRERRASNFADMLIKYAGCKIIVAAHSEGTATVLRALKFSNLPAIHSLHLFCGAADSDCRRNGLNDAFKRGLIKDRVWTYVATKDEAMKLEDTYLGSLFFGLQTWGQPLGLNGPTCVATEFLSRVLVVELPGYGHSTCFDSSHFLPTLEATYRLSS